MILMIHKNQPLISKFIITGDKYEGYPKVSGLSR